MSLDLSQAITSPAPVGTVVTWTANASAADPGTLWYRYRSRYVGEDFHVIKDYGPDATLDWTAAEHEGLYQVEASVRNLSTGEISVATANFEMRSRVTGDQPVVSPTSNALVSLYSAPACPAGSRMQVQFQRENGAIHRTPYKDCQPGLSMNFYLAGMYPNTTYTAQHTIDTGLTFRLGPAVTLTTGTPPAAFVNQMVVQPPPTPSPEGVLLQAALFSDTVATDLNGSVIWYYSGGITAITRPEPGGYFFAFLESATGDQSQQLVREFDLAGLTTVETNAARVNEQLAAIGMRSITAFHHEARLLADGNILVLGAVEQVLSDVQGPGPVDILGDMIIILDPNLQLLWAWDAFDHLDVTRMATLGDMCLPGDCPSLFLSTTANDWLHGNCVQQTPDGDLLYSSRSQDWVMKIDYRNGAGAGGIVWRLGKDGDFQIDSSDPNPRVSHQHDPQFLPDGKTIMLFDNGNARNLADPTANSRGQMIRLDEQNRTATVVLNADLGQYSFALGAAQKLPNGDFHFDIGYLADGSSYSVEIDPSGNTVYALHVATPVYRSFRMRDLYTP